MYVIQFPTDKPGKRNRELENEQERRRCAEAEARYWKEACNALLDLHFSRQRRMEMLRILKGGSEE